MEMHVTLHDDDRKSLIKLILGLEKTSSQIRRGEKYVEFDELMQVLVGEWHRLRISELLILESLFMACDISGDGVFSSDDFHGMMVLLRDSVTK
jgi:hypothetical protein